MRPLGVNQRSVLECLVDHGSWPHGWTWGTEQNTIRILDTLVDRGLVQVAGKGRFTTGTYTATEAGRAEVGPIPPLVGLSELEQAEAGYQAALEAGDVDARERAEEAMQAAQDRAAR